MKIISILALVFLGACGASDTPSGTQQHAPVRMEFRLVATEISADKVRSSTRGGELVLLERAMLFGSSEVASAVSDVDGVDIKLNEEGTRKLAEITRSNKGRQLAIVVDGVVLVTPEIGEPIEDGRLWIGELTGEEARRIAGGLGSK
ncbi:MAG: hypothetical protein AB7F75_00500 [Planctomycetota bacterium]